MVFFSIAVEIMSIVPAAFTIILSLKHLHIPKLSIITDRLGMILNAVFGVNSPLWWGRFEFQHEKESPMFYGYINNQHIHTIYDRCNVYRCRDAFFCVWNTLKTTFIFRIIIN